LIELVVAVSVAMLIVAFAVPGMRTFFLNNATAGVTEQMVATLNYARSQALSLRTPVALCWSGDLGSDETASPTCDLPNAGGYESGWVVFTDKDSAQTMNLATAIDSKLVLRATAPGRDGGITIRGYPAAAPNPAARFIRFSSTGALSQVAGTDPGQDAYLVVCDRRGWKDNGAHARVIRIAQGGGQISVVAGNDPSLNNAVSSCTPS
jgi:Tfp pilus assembly protein FimT